VTVEAHDETVLVAKAARAWLDDHNVLNPTDEQFLRAVAAVSKQERKPETGVRGYTITARRRSSAVR
jgi:hypothetical protein